VVAKAFKDSDKGDFGFANGVLMRVAVGGASFHPGNAGNIAIVGGVPCCGYAIAGYVNLRKSVGIVFHGAV
jgi:hypothetical protein